MITDAQPYFHPLATDELKNFILKNGVRKQLAKNECYKQADESLCAVAYVESGLCYYQYISDTSEQIIIAIAPPGSVMGEAAYLTPIKIPLIIRAKRATTLITLPFSEMQKFCKNNFKLYESIVYASMQKFRSYTEGMLLNFTHKPEERLRFLMRSVINYSGTRNGEWSRVPIRLTHEECGEIISASRVTVNRIFNLWKRDELMKTVDGEMYVKKSLYENIVF